MVSVITCTRRESCLENVFSNYERQQLDEKELIIVLTKMKWIWGYGRRKQRNIKTSPFSK
ncbi:hypothetical protein [Bacillus sp. Marseille-Q3570]|uniref:hypothetical protein n=1 Tax=Bacillus sp. Marseille-Q3570 TaxID=2963522 RepID=UPI0021B7148E|nr:hypothetical protein [Bacillus sp. Marseille-Q3570]